MPEPNTPAPHGDEGLPEEAGEALQFDQAEFATPAGDGPACVVCHQPIADEYYELNSKVFCRQCRRGVEAAFRGGSRIARVIKALILGSMAAMVGAVLYYAIIRLTGWNIGLVSVLVGLMVGGAVRRGSGNRGGLGYQFLALFLTYSSIVAMNAPDLFEALTQTAKKELQNDQKQAKARVEKLDRDRAKAKVTSPTEDKAAKAGKVETKPSEATPALARAPGAANKAGPSPKDTEVVELLPNARAPRSPDISELLVGLIVLIGIAYAVPLIKAFYLPISGLIFSFALWEAWKLNRRLVLAFNGPFRLGKATPDATYPEVLGDEL